MSTVNLTSMTDAQLAALIAAASSELAARMNAPRIERVPAPEPASVVVLREPAAADKDFVLRLKTEVMRGGYVSAGDRERIAELAAAGFDEWIRRQGLPTERGTWAWRKLAERVRVKPARER